MLFCQQDTHNFLCYANIKNGCLQALFYVNYRLHIISTTLKSTKMNDQNDMVFAKALFRELEAETMATGKCLERMNMDLFEYERYQDTVSLRAIG